MCVPQRHCKSHASADKGALKTGDSASQNRSSVQQTNNNPRSRKTERSRNRYRSRSIETEIQSEKIIVRSPDSRTEMLFRITVLHHGPEKVGKQVSTAGTIMPDADAGRPRHPRGPREVVLSLGSSAAPVSPNAQRGYKIQFKLYVRAHIQTRPAWLSRWLPDTAMYRRVSGGSISQMYSTK
jgi:hypothetical protein